MWCLSKGTGRRRFNGDDGRAWGQCARLKQKTLIALTRKHDSKNPNQKREKASSRYTDTKAVEEKGGVGKKRLVVKGLEMEDVPGAAIREATGPEAGRAFSINIIRRKKLKKTAGERKLDRNEKRMES